MTSSARPSTAIGNERPSSFAVLFVGQGSVRASHIYRRELDRLVRFFGSAAKPRRPDLPAPASLCTAMDSVLRQRSVFDASRSIARVVDGPVVSATTSR